MQNDSKHEAIKTALIGAAALVALVVWLRFQPRLPDMAPQEKIGQKLFPDFNNPNEMTRVQLRDVDPQTGTPRVLTLAKSGDAWSLPEFSFFPAENSERLAKIIAPLVQLTVLDVLEETFNSADVKRIEELHRECGLVNPLSYDPDLDTEELEAAGGAGVATNRPRKAALSVSIDGESGEKLVDLLVGCRVPDSSAARDVRFVRFPNDDVVYLVDFSGDSMQEAGSADFTEYPERISFNPIDWTNPNLLRASRWNILFLTCRDYAFSVTRSENVLEIKDFRNAGAAVFRQTPDNPLSLVWSLEREVKSIEDGSFKEVDGAEASVETLNELSDAIANLKIVDVRQKPEALTSLFLNGRIGTELTAQAEVLSEFGYATSVADPLDQNRIEPTLVGEGGAVVLAMKSGVTISVVFGRRFDDRRACVAYAQFDSATLEQTTENQGEIAFLAADAKKEAQAQNARFAKWFYLISEDSYQKLRFRLADVVK